eukprot:14212961-Alexandrium_andersonii.AAC.1
MWRRRRRRRWRRRAKLGNDTRVPDRLRLAERGRRGRRGGFATRCSMRPGGAHRGRGLGVLKRRTELRLPALPPPDVGAAA